MSEAIEELVIKKASANEIARAAISEGMVTMEQDGFLKVLTGQTTLDEVLRVTKTE
jgi:type II secretory ATPase GspE/PulE/Tfp pilus assembly ATPase PilB-like protein